MASRRSTKKGAFIKITNPGLILLLWDLFFGLPIAYALAHLNKRVFQYLGYEKFMVGPGGARLNQGVFVLVNVWLVLGWGWQLIQEAKVEREENIRLIKNEIKFWDEEIERLQGLLDAKLIEAQLKGRQRAESEGGEEKKMVIIDGEIKWVKKGDRKVFTPREVKRVDGLAAWKKVLREPSPFARP